MGTLSIKPHTRNFNLPAIHRVEAARPFAWLRQGWSDLLHSWPLSLATGGVFTLIGYFLMEFAWPRAHLGLALTTGFLLVAPFLAIVFYELSRRREAQGAGRYFEGARQNLSSIGLFALLLTFALSSWERLSAILVALFLRSENIGGGPFSLGMLFTPDHLGFVVPYMLAGGALAALVFALSVVSLPMLMDRNVDIATAIMTSLWVVRENPVPMAVWAFVIGALTLLSQLAWLAPLVVIFPLLGHATWHAYRDLVGSD
ncbi:MAG: DUF2189 domain-containing protein [Pseudomonadota bacterium]